MTSRFNTLLLREWMQHKRGWLITMLLPPLIFLAILPFGSVQDLDQNSPLLTGLLIVAITAVAVFALSYSSLVFQLPGLARRDHQDRSIEFWLSLPAGHSESIAATLVAHAVLVPMAALTLGFGLGLMVIAPAVMLKSGGMDVASNVAWVSVLALGLPGLFRLLFGVMLMSLWLAPLAVAVMASSAWLKRWGVPAVALAVAGGGLLLEKMYGTRIVWNVLGAQLQGAIDALMFDPEKFLAMLNNAQNTGSPFNAWAFMANDAGGAVQNLVAIQPVSGLLLAAGCFALLVLKRSRSN